ncbi:MAG: carboxypeptidase-like regulatory domain-containing protein, partial [Acidobacteria bacterium]|nr:carboxypeptidase-like regulatory domain-containing protein [Acidobacteriota bacterium]
MHLKAIALLALALPAMAQFDAASVLGTVRDAKGGTIATAVVTLLNVNTGITAKTSSDSSGEYLFPSVKIGTYKVSAETPGFSTAIADNVVLTVNARQRV